METTGAADVLGAKAAAAALWARTGLRTRWRSLVVLGILAGLVAGLAASAAAGARRTGTAVERLRDRTNASDAIVFPGQVGVFHADWTALRARPEVAALARWTLTYGAVEGYEGEGVFFVPSDGQWLQHVDRPVVVSGRMFDPNAADEVVIGETLTKPSPDLGGPPLAVGSVVKYRPYLVDQDDTSGEPPAGPELTLRVVGVVRHVHEFLFVPGMVMPSPAFLDVHGKDLLLVENAMVRLRHGAADVAQLREDVGELVAPGTPVDDLHVIQRRVDTTISVERSALFLLAAAILLAGFMLVAQALIRSISVPDDEVLVLRAMGFDKVTHALAVVFLHALVAAVGVGTTLATAIVASRWFPIGLAGRIEPDAGMHADWPVLALAVGLVAVAILAPAAAMGWRMGAPRPANRPSSSSSMASRISQRLPVVADIGARMAFRRERRLWGMARPAVIGAVVGVLGVVGTITLDHGLNDALANPARAGVTWDATVVPAEPDRTPTGISENRLSSIRAVEGVQDVAVVSRLVSDVNGAGVPTFSTDSADHAITLATTAGRPPADDGEAAIGPATARQLGVGMGDTVTVGSLGRRVRIVGQALFPSDVHAGFDEGLWLTPATLDAIEPPAEPGTFAGADRWVAVQFRPGLDREEAFARLAAEVGPTVTAVVPAAVPPELTNLRNVRSVPRLLAAFLTLLAVAAVAHVLTTSVRRERREFATLRALGMTRRATRAILNMQGTAIALTGLVIGVPVGIAAGRIGWRLVTDRVPLTFEAPVAWLAMLALVPISIALVNVLAAWPGQAAARLRPAEVLRDE